MKNKLALFGLLTILLSLLINGQVFAGAAVFYNPQPSGSTIRPLDNCLEGDFKLNPPIVPTSSQSTPYYCVDINGNDTTNGMIFDRTTESTNRKCNTGEGGIDLDGFGFHCLMPDFSDSMYTVRPQTSTTNGAPIDNPTWNQDGGGAGTGVEQPKYVKDDCRGKNLQAGADEGDEDKHCGILNYLVIFINLLSALVGIVVVGSIIYGGIQYSTAGSDAQRVSAAKNRIRNAIVALLFFIFMYSFLNYLVPGGVL